VAIKTSASQEVRRLIADLTALEPVATKREAAVARLAVIGTRAVRQLIDALASARTGEARTAVLSALEAIPDARAIEPVLAHLASTDLPVRLAAARAARELLPLAQGTVVLDRLTSIAIDRAQAGDLRALAIEALATLPPRTVRPVLEQLQNDASPAVRAALLRQGAVTDDPVVDLEEASDGWLPRDPDALLQLVARAGSEAPLSTLHRLIERVRSKEEEGRKSRRKEWRAVRGALHLALARRGSRVALYDLRESIERAEEPLPADFLEALALVGDASSLEPIATAFVQSAAMPDAEAWRRSVKDTFQAIVAREGITPRHAAMRRVKSRFREHVASLIRIPRPQSAIHND
jgi:HEAT repeat protein